MVTDDERRKVAKLLRGMSGDTAGLSDGEFIDLVEDVVRGGDAPASQDLDAAFLNRLAELIDPDPDLTCELEPTASERTDAPVRVYECDCCGKSCDSVYAEDYVYCPYCGRLNTAREVEVGE